MISIKCFKGLPQAYEPFLIEKYDSWLTTCRYIELFNKSSEFYYLLFFEDDILKDLLIFKDQGEKFTCLNELAFIDQEIVVESTNYIFKNFPSVQKIFIESLYNDLNMSKSVLFRRSDDFVIELPSTMDCYLHELGHCNRKNIQRLRNKLLREYPTVNYVTKIGPEIEESVVDRIVHMNFDRTISKGEVPNKNHNITENIFKYSQSYGCVTYIEIDGVVIAGCIGGMGKKNMTALIIGHDNDYSKNSVGLLSMVYFIQTTIEKGFSSLHMLWGELEYKARLLAKPLPSLSYIVFRNYSPTYALSKLKELNGNVLNKIRLSKYSLPLRNALKRIRRKSVKQLSKIQY